MPDLFDFCPRCGSKDRILFEDGDLHCCDCSMPLKKALLILWYDYVSEFREKLNVAN